MSQFAMAHGGSSRRERLGTGGFSAPPEDWEGSRLRELEEARARAAQMEKTMRWWSECTANWREKWSKVRNERNKCREESKLLRSKLDAALKDLSAYKKDKQELELNNEQMRKELERIHLLLLKHAGQWDNQLIEALDGVMSGEVGDGIAEGDNAESGDKEQQIKVSTEEKEKDSPNRVVSETPCGPRESPVGSEDGETTAAKSEAAELQQRLEETLRALQTERMERVGLEERVERLEEELAEARGRAEELRAGRAEAVKELLQLQDQHADALALVRADLVDETNSREGMDRRLAELRSQLERAQAESATEWGRRERAECEKIAFEREAKRLRAQLREAHERIETRPAGDPVRLHQEIADKTRELIEMKHSYSKLKRVAAERALEAGHASRRAEQHEAEVRRLRSRVDELRRDLAVAEDEVDAAMENIRKQQRTNDELQEQIENLQVQVDQLHARTVTRVKKEPKKEEISSRVTR